ncbi:hypothetical protein SAMN05421739_10855 [Pontibacter chinhatensis]|uniref:Uncharacterized protein n=1 Tax=Pontibacter chinhatensis TaxID=1436961 RepID=A0A1I2YGD1_9BACT|nr:hypothetical protein SAMN05421739_10855 [Pontibacter chinhatensis]
MIKGVSGKGTLFAFMVIWRKSLDSCPFVVSGLKLDWLEKPYFTLAAILYTFLAAASRNSTQAILVSDRSSSRLLKLLLHLWIWCPPRPGGLAFGHRAVYISFAFAMPLRRHRKSTRRSTQRLGIDSIATSIAVISTFGIDLFRITDRSLALLEMIGKVGSINSSLVD